MIGLFRENMQLTLETVLGAVTIYFMFCHHYIIDSIHKIVHTLKVRYFCFKRLILFLQKFKISR